MKLERLDPLPLAIMNSVTGDTIKLMDYAGKKLLLSFFRDTACPYTNLWLEGLVKNKSFFEEHNLSVIGVFNDTPMKVMKSMDIMNVNFPVVADENLNIYSEFGIQTSNLGRVKSLMKFRNIKKLLTYKGIKGKSKTNILPAEFLIDEKGLIYNAHYGQDYADHIRTKDIIKWIKK